MTTKKTKAEKPSPAPEPDVISPFRQWADRPGEAAMLELCEFLVSNGTDGNLAFFCRGKGFAYSTVRAWIEDDKVRSAMYARAREDRADILADEIISISDEVSVIEKTQGQGDDAERVIVMDATAIARNRLRVDARKWAASKLKPRLYGDKVALTGEDGGVLKIETIRRTIVDPKGAV